MKGTFVLVVEGIVAILVSVSYDPLPFKQYFGLVLIGFCLGILFMRIPAIYQWLSD